MQPLTTTNQNKKMETNTTDKPNTPASGLHEPTCSAVTVPREEYDALLQDKARLDFLEAAHAAFNERYGANYGWELIINSNVVRYMAGNCYPRDAYPGIDLHDSKAGNAKLPTCRDAIDKYLPNAIGEATPPEPQ
jgi:hypothetical protein